MSTFVLIIFPILLKSSNILCDRDWQCDNQEFHCTNNQDCTIICSAVSACYDSTFICPSSSNNKCNIKCDSTQSTGACQKTIINGTNSLLSVIITGYEYQFSEGIIDCGMSKQCNIQCGNDAINNNNMCSNSIINASISSNLNIISYGMNSLQYSNIICPNKGNCNITIIGNKGELLSNSKIYIYNQIQTNLLMKCNSNNILNDCNGAILYCYNSKYNCKYITNDGINWYCKESTSPCSINSINPTYSPTHSPTYLPIYYTTNNILTTHNNIIHIESWNYVSIQFIIISLILIFIIMIICIITIYKYKQNTNSKKEMEKFRFYITITKMISFALSYFGWLCIICMDNFDINNIHIIYVLFEIITYLSFIIGWMSLYILMLNKLYYIFKDSIYKMSI